MDFNDEETAAKYAFEQTIALAKQGDPAAQYAVALAILNFADRDFPHRDEQVFRWMRLAALQGHVPAQLFLKENNEKWK